MIITSYKNGNAVVTLYNNGTRIIDYKEPLDLEYPLNIDIKVSNKCAFGYNPKTKKAFCTFCHESARTDGQECDYLELQNKLKSLPKGIELAIGSNTLTKNLVEFLEWCKDQDFICNLTINQGHINRDLELLRYCIHNSLIKGLGISYRSELKLTVPKEILNYPNTVFHVITGIDNYYDIRNLKKLGVNKILVLGEKDFGFNIGNVNLESQSHKIWYYRIRELFDTFDVVSFDNLAIEQLNIKRFFTSSDWPIFNQGEESFYIDAVKKVFKPSSRSNSETNWNNISIKKYFNELKGKIS